MADSTDDIMDRLVAAPIAASRMSEEDAGPANLAQAPLRPATRPGPGDPGDPIL